MATTVETRPRLEGLAITITMAITVETLPQLEGLAITITMAITVETLPRVQKWVQKAHVAGSLQEGSKLSAE